MSVKREREGEIDIASSAKKVRKGGLKLKGSALPVLGKKKKKQTELKEEASEAPVQQVEDDSISKRTDAEIRFEAMRRERLQQTAAEEAKKSYRDNIQSNNVKLSKMSEHHDIPKVTYRTNK